MTDIPEPGEPGYPSDRLGQLRNYVCRLDDNDEMIELDDVLGYLDEAGGLAALIDPTPGGMQRRFTAWASHRLDLKHTPTPEQAWADSDDVAVFLLRDIAAALGWTEDDDA